MAKLKITIEPLAIVCIFLFIYFGWIEEILFYIIALVMHEYAHYFVARKLGYNLSNIKFSPFGAVLNGCNNFFKKKDEIVIALAGPLINLAMGMVIVAIWWIFPETYSITYFFALANFSLFICNMMPLFPLDAGRIVLVLIKDIKRSEKIYKLYKVNSVIIGILLIVLFVISAFERLNLSLLFMSILLISSIWSMDKQIYYKYAYMDKIANDYDKILPVKEFCVPVDVSKYQLLKLINKNTYTIFVFVDKNGNIVNKLDEKQLIASLQDIRI